jgi:hypothetical protein
VAPSTRSSRAVPRRSRLGLRWLAGPLAFLLLGAPTCTGGNSVTSETKTMDPNLQPLHSDDPVVPEHATRPLRDVPAAPAGLAVDPTGGGAVCSHANPRRNGRSGVDVAVGPWHAAWSVTLEPSAPAQAVLAVQDRIVVQALGRWSLHDRVGKQLRAVARVEGDVVIDPDAKQVLYADANGFLGVARLDDGALELLVEVQFGDGYSRTVLWRKGRELGVHGFALPQMTHGSAPAPDHTVLEVIDLGDPVVADAVKFVTSSRKLAGMSSHTVPLLVAADGSELVMACSGRVYRADARLKVIDDLAEDFTPVALSLDERSHAYLVVRSKGKAALWVLDPKAGERHVTALLPGDPTAVPPLVGWDHRTFVLLQTGVVAIEPDGSTAWTVSTAQAPVGAAIARSGVLLVSVGSQVLLIEADGRSRTALDVGEPLATAPVLVSDRELLVATPTRLVGAAPGVRPHH